MKIIIACLLSFYISESYAQQSKMLPVLNYVEYADSVREWGKQTKGAVGNVKMWFNDSVSYQQYWLRMGSYSISPTKGRPTKKDRIMYIEYHKQFVSQYYAQKINVHKVAASNGGRRMYFDYDIRPGKTTAYFSPIVYRDSINLINDQQKIILGFKCNLALFNLKNDVGNNEIIKVWYTKEIALPFGPERFAQQLPGLVMKVESSVHNYTMIKLDVRGTEIPTFEVEPKKDEIFAYEAAYVLLKKRYDDSLKKAAK